MRNQSGAITVDGRSFPIHCALVSLCPGIGPTTFGRHANNVVVVHGLDEHFSGGAEPVGGEDDQPNSASRPRQHVAASRHPCRELIAA